jgi:hypothetical protein
MDMVGLFQMPEGAVVLMVAVVILNIWEMRIRMEQTRENTGLRNQLFDALRELDRNTR